MKKNVKSKAPHRDGEGLTPANSDKLPQAVVTKMNRMLALVGEAGLPTREDMMKKYPNR